MPCSSRRTPAGQRSVRGEGTCHVSCGCQLRNGILPSESQGRGHQTPSCRRKRLRILHSPRRCGESSGFQPMPQRWCDGALVCGLKLLRGQEFVPVPSARFWAEGRQQAFQYSWIPPWVVSWEVVSGKE